jgi:ceramide glucosyltransferase
MNMIPKRLRYAVETLLVNVLIVSSVYQLLVYLANWRFWRQFPPPPADEPPSISVIVPLRGKNLDTFALLNLIAVSGPSNRYEVLLVLESADDPAAAIAQELAQNYPRIVRIVLSGPAGARTGKMHNFNAGYQAATGDLIVVADANVQLSAELWHAILAVMDDPAVGAAFAPPLVPEPDHGLMTTGGEMLLTLHINHARSVTLPFAALSNRVSGLVGGLMIFRRRVLDEAGGLLMLLDEAADDIALGRMVRACGYRVAVVPVPVYVVPEPQTFNGATNTLLRHLMIQRAYRPKRFLAWPFTNPLIVGLALGWITEREGRWWGRRLWWGLAALRIAFAYDLDRLRFGRGFTWIAYAQLFMMDTFILPALWAQAIISGEFTWRGRTYRLLQGGKAVCTGESAE